MAKLKTLNEGHGKTVQELNDVTALLDQERAATRATLVKQTVDNFVSQRVAQGMEDGARALLSSVDVSVKAWTAHYVFRLSARKILKDCLSKVILLIRFLSRTI